MAPHYTKQFITKLFNNFITLNDKYTRAFAIATIRIHKQVVSPKPRRKTIDSKVDSNNEIKNQPYSFN